jgi:hypothetical protein
MVAATACATPVPPNSATMANAATTMRAARRSHR